VPGGTAGIIIITTTGARTGRARRIEIRFHRADGTVLSVSDLAMAA
jgi:hypothetical protein